MKNVLLAQCSIPTCRLDIHQHCSAGIRDVSDVDTAIFASCQILKEHHHLLLQYMQYFTETIVWLWFVIMPALQYTDIINLRS